VFGEAGPEAIMPLTRAADGSLGVRALNGGSSGQLPTASAPVSVEINIDSNGGAQVSSDTAGLQQFGQEMGRIAEAKYREMETRSLSSQGNIRQAINGRR
jgi:phage-related minor tail protein